MKDFITGLLLMISCFSCIQFWFWFAHLEKTKQVELKDFIFKKK